MTSNLWEVHTHSNTKLLNNHLMRVETFTNAHTIFRPYLAGV